MSWVDDETNRIVFCLDDGCLSVVNVADAVLHDPIYAWCRRVVVVVLGFGKQKIILFAIDAHLIISTSFHHLSNRHPKSHFHK